MKIAAPPMVGNGQWRLVDSFEALGYTIPEDFVCDLDSVPRVPFVYSRYKGRTVAAAVLHDFFYKRQVVSREKADRYFLAAMALEGVPVRYCVVMYVAVRIGGFLPWKRNRSKL
jgi:hypothetical protein